MFEKIKTPPELLLLNQGFWASQVSFLKYILFCCFFFIFFFTADRSPSLYLRLCAFCCSNARGSQTRALKPDTPEFNFPISLRQSSASSSSAPPLSGPDWLSPPPTRAEWTEKRGGGVLASSSCDWTLRRLLVSVCWKLTHMFNLYAGLLL